MTPEGIAKHNDDIFVINTHSWGLIANRIPSWQQRICFFPPNEHWKEKK